VQVLLVLVALAISVAVSRELLLNRLDQRIDRQLLNEADELRALAADGVDPATGVRFAEVDALLRTQLSRSVPDRSETQFSIVDGRVDARSAQTPPARIDTDDALVSRLATISGPVLGSTQSTQGSVRYAAVPVVLPGDRKATGVYVVAVFRDVEAQEVDDAVRVLALVGLAAALVAGLLAWVLAGRVLAPLDRLSATSRRVSDKDLTERVEVTGSDDISDVARAFNAMLDRLELAFAEQRRFADDAGHELRTPLTIVRGHVELMSDDPQVRATQRAVVLDEIDRMSVMVDDLLTLTRSGQPEFVRPSDVDLEVLQAELAAKVTQLADRDWRFTGSVDGAARIDRHRVTQAVLQLAQNATQHTEPGDRIEVGTTSDGSMLRIAVHDSGPGVPVEDRELLFDRFARGHDSRRLGPGSGLGLSIVRAIAVAHHGTVAFEEPEDGRGALVVLTLPVDAGESEERS